MGGLRRSQRRSDKCTAPEWRERLWSDPSLLIATGARVGDTLTLGFGHFVITGTLKDVPGTSRIGAALEGPRIYVSQPWYLLETAKPARVRRDSRIHRAPATSRRCQPSNLPGSVPKATRRTARECQDGHRERTGNGQDHGDVEQFHWSCGTRCPAARWHWSREWRTGIRRTEDRYRGCAALPWSDEWSKTRDLRHSGGAHGAHRGNSWGDDWCHAPVRAAAGGRTVASDGRHRQAGAACDRVWQHIIIGGWIASIFFVAPPAGAPHSIATPNAAPRTPMPMCCASIGTMCHDCSSISY